MPLSWTIWRWEDLILTIIVLSYDQNGHEIEEQFNGCKDGPPDIQENRLHILANLYP